VSVGGGEPTLRDDLEACIAGFRDDGMGVHINTNALAVDRTRAQSLAEAGLSVAYISCDHPDRDGYKAVRGVDGLDRVVAAIGHFRSLPRPIPVGINVVVSRLNQDVLERLAARSVEWGVQKVQFIPVQTYLRYREMDRSALQQLVPRREHLPDIKATLQRVASRLRERGIETNSSFFIDHFEKAYEPIRSVPCLAGTLFVMINPFGYVAPCYQWAKDLNIREMPLDEIVRSRAFRDQRASVRGCRRTCWDTGSAEPSIRFHFPYLLRHPVQIYREARMHLR
jgi:MoaA/NifB/PqqE/SkfB family radical SAM enzyme